ncbi:MAG: hypothetical protein QOE70_4781 [Chthoniobacter sp.]|jgi:hypothetical protein|nr:hypothetical protein [Chthoniobacter sp.]
MNKVLQASGTLLFSLLVICQSALGQQPPQLLSSSARKTGTTATLKAVWIPNTTSDNPAYPLFYYKPRIGSGTEIRVSGIPNSIPVDGHAAGEPVAVVARITGLARSKTYSWRVFAGYQLEGGSTSGTDGVGDDFTSSIPEILTVTEGAVTSTTAAITVQLIPNDNQEEDSTGTNSVFVEYGTDTSYGTISPVQSVPIYVDPDLGTNAFDPATLNFNLAGLQPGTTYHYRIKATNPDFDPSDPINTTAFSLDQTFITLPQENDSFASPQTLPGISGTVTGTNANATKEAGEPNHAGVGGGASVWFQWTPPVTGPATIDTLTSSFDTVLATYTGDAVDSLISIIGNDDDPAGGLQSKVRFNAVAGTVYRIAVDGFGGATGNITLHYSIDGAPTITTPTSASITENSATLGGNVTSDGGVLITESGVVYSITAVNNDPIIGGAGVTMLAGSGTTGEFNVSASGLTAGTGYSFNAYVTNSVGTAYTSPVANFTTAPNIFAITTSSSPANGGTTSGGGNFTGGTDVTVQATAAAGYQFINWTENGVEQSTSASYPFTVSAARALVANFNNLPTFAITTSSAPANGGTTGGGGRFTSGKNVTVQATTAAGYLFVNWTEGGVEQSKSANYPFTVSAARNVVANFIPLSDLRGTYRGIIWDVNQKPCGLAAATLLRGRVTCVIELLGAKGTTSASVSNLGQVDTFTSGSALSALLGGSRRLQLAVEPSPRRLALRIETGPADSTALYSAILVPKNAAYNQQNPAPLSGNYTVLFPVDSAHAGDPGFPQGCGYATMTIAADGTAKLVGKVGDGTGLMLSSVLSAESDLPVYKTLYQKPKGFLVGSLVFGHVSGDSDAKGNFSWVKPTQLTPAGIYPSFELEETGIASRYSASTVTLAGTLTLDKNGLSPAIAHSIYIPATGGNLRLALQDLNRDQLVLSLDAKKGLLTGTFRPFGKPPAAPIRGVLFLERKGAAGLWLSTGAGRFEIAWP